jgi:hypothetical protein
MRSVYRQIRAAVVLAAAYVLSPLAMQAQARDLSGIYNAAVNSPQGAVKVVITLKKEGGAMTGSLAAEGFPTLPVSSATPTADGVKVVADSPDGGVTVDIKFGAGDKMTGMLTYQGMEMPIEGTFAAGGGAMAFSPGGEYVLKTIEPMLGESALEIVCTISKGADGKYAGTCTAAAGSAPVSQVTVAGNVVTMGGESPAGPYSAAATVVGTEVTGTLTLGGETAKFKGTFTAK